MAPLPFDRTADVTDQGGTATAEAVPCSPIWPSGSRPGPGGQVYDARAQVHMSVADASLSAAQVLAALQATNAKLVVGGTRYSIVSAEEAEFLPHVECLLRRVRGG